MAIDQPLSKREREIMEILHREGPITAKEVQSLMKSPPSYSAVRSTLSILEEKGHLGHRVDGQTYIYRPTTSPRRARLKALDHVLETFFGGSPEELVATLLASSKKNLDPHDLERIHQLVEDARKEGR